MPNYCENELRVSIPWFKDEDKDKEIAAKEELQKFKEFAKSGTESEERVIDFNKFVPYPTNFEEQDAVSQKREEERNKAIEEGMSREEAYKKYPCIKDGFNDGGYNWRIENWGTKWNSCYPELVEETEDELNYEFRTAWGPPEPVVKKMGEMFPLLDFDLRYFEMGAAFNGILRIEQGEITQEEEGKYFGNRGG